MLEPYNRPTRSNRRGLPDFSLFMLGLAVLVLFTSVSGFRVWHSTGIAHDGETPVWGAEGQGKSKTLSPGSIVFTGASSLAYWSSLVDDMKPLRVVNSAF